jgi:hypothetical protein
MSPELREAHTDPDDDINPLADWRNDALHYFVAQGANR